MLLAETIRLALSALRANKIRALLTMLGIVIGIGAVIAIIAIGNGANNSIRERIARLGTTVLQINPARVQQGGIQTGATAKLTVRDVEMIRARAPSVVAVNWQQDRSLQVIWNNKNAVVQITGTAPNFLEVRGFKIAHGRMFGAADDGARRRVAVIGADVLPLLDVTDGQSLLDTRIKLAGVWFTVIGVLAAKGSTGFGDADQQILIPFQTGRFLTFGTDRINDIWVLASSEDAVTTAMAEVQLALRRSHKLRAGRPDDFSIRNQADLLETLSETTQTFTFLLAGIAAVSLLVGGIGIMNIMLVSVTERTREIGVRKALGATRMNILLQFMTEAVVLCLLGGAVGIAAGAGGAMVFSHAVGWKTTIDTRSVVIAVSFASGVGVLFGVWPARRASILNPIEALRYE
jgi:putative ABC transport system permease protein